MKKYVVILLFFFVVPIALSSGKKPHTLNFTSHVSETDDVDKMIQEERNEIYMLLAYSVVYKNWQTRNSSPRRGHNIGAILVNPEGKVVFWARNANHITGNETQHAEVRAMQGYLSKTKARSLPGYTIYTTLEPCAMCSGMLILQQVNLVVYGQTDPPYGKAVERLALNSSQLKNGYKPYPRTQGLRALVSHSNIRILLDQAYDDEVQNTGNESITAFLLTEQAQKIYELALNEFLHYKVQYHANQDIYKQAKIFWQSTSKGYVTLSRLIKQIDYNKYKDQHKLLWRFEVARYSNNKSLHKYMRTKSF